MAGRPKKVGERVEFRIRVTSSTLARWRRVKDENNLKFDQLPQGKISQTRIGIHASNHTLFCNFDIFTDRGYTVAARLSV
jgi:hypothetical protein